MPVPKYKELDLSELRNDLLKMRSELEIILGSYKTHLEKDPDQNSDELKIKMTALAGFEAKANELWNKCLNGDALSALYQENKIRAESELEPEEVEFLAPYKKKVEEAKNEHSRKKSENAFKSEQEEKSSEIKIKGFAWDLELIKNNKYRIAERAVKYTKKEIVEPFEALRIEFDTKLYPVLEKRRGHDRSPALQKFLDTVLGFFNKISFNLIAKVEGKDTTQSIGRLFDQIGVTKEEVAKVVEENKLSKK